MAGVRMWTNTKRICLAGRLRDGVVAVLDHRVHLPDGRRLGVGLRQETGVFGKEMIGKHLPLGIATLVEAVIMVQRLPGTIARRRLHLDQEEVVHQDRQSRQGQQIMLISNR